ncbi:helicase HerA domain-containing protein [Ruminococcus flavefaciens]|uniref:helicase HerA domain-containing protein n=1 Tax=Ruminococcus flavefaciens TaxID=1265 RepID=UPI001563A2F7|nr:DUF87 domain-containing protein [Ruminococcus flavefaciens]
MNTRGPTSNQIQKQGQALQPISQHELAVQAAIELINTQHRLGLSLTIWDKNLNKISGKFKSMADLLRNPDFISKLSQDLYVSNNNDTTWFKLRLKNGKLAAITFLLTLHINWIKIINKTFYSYDFIVVGYTPGDGNAEVATTVIPRSDVTPEKIVKHFPQLIGQTATPTKEAGKLICYMLTQYLVDPKPNTLEHYGFKQGFAKNLKGQFQFNPAKMLPEEILPYMPIALTSRQYPIGCQREGGEEVTPILDPLFSEQKDFQILLLNRLGSWHSSFFARKDVYADNILIVKPTAEVPVSLSVAMLKNTRYDSLDAAPIGPNIKPLKFDLETVSDGMVVAIDVFAADKVKKAEKGYDLLISDATGATDNSNGVHHISALISEYADLYIPKELRCVLEFADTSVEYSAEAYKVALKRLDANLIKRTERSCNNGDFIKVFNNYIDEIRSNIPDKIPHSKHNTYVMLITALRMYNEWYTPLFCPDIEQYIQEWLCSQEQEIQPLYDVICSDFGLHFNKKLADGYFRFTLKDEVTQVDKGTHTIVVDRAKCRVYVETADTYEIAKDEMTSVDNPEIVPAALYSGEYLPHNAKDEKSIRIAAISSDGVPYPLYVHAISYKLLTQENKLRFDLLDKEANLFKYDEIPREGFLPLIKTVDGRFAGKMLRYAAEESNIYFGTGKTGSGKSWAIAQLICMLFMLGQIVVVFDVSGSYTKEKLLKMLPAEVVEKLFKFINVGAEYGMDMIPIDLGSLRGCETLPDKKRAIYSVLRAATGPIDKGTSRKLKGFLSDYLKDKEYSVSLNNLCSELEKTGGFGAGVADCVQSVLDDINEVGYEEQTWDDLFLQERKIIVINLGNEVGDSTHQLLDMMVGSLFNWQMSHDSGFLSIAIDELIDQDFSTGSPLQTIVKQGRKFHTALIGATQDYYNQGSSYLDVMKQANMKSFCRPGKSEDRVAQKLGYSNAVDAGFNKFKAGDTILEFDGYNKETGENEALTIKGRVVNFVETPLFEKFKEIYGF